MKKTLLILFLLISFQSIAQKAKYQSVFIYQFTKYFNWPSQMKQGNFKIGFIGKSDMYDYIKELASVKKVENQDIELMEFGSVADISATHILILGKSANQNIHEILNAMKNTNTLVIGEGGKLAQMGVHINFVEDSGKISFEINHTAIQKSSLKVNSQLIALASNKY